MWSDNKEKSAGELTPKRRRDRFRKRGRCAIVIGRGQTRSLMGYSFLNGVRAPRRPPPMDGSSRPETKVHRGTAQLYVSAALPEGELLSLPLRSILRLRPCFFPEREGSRSPEVHLTCGTALRACGTYGERFAQRGFKFFCSQAESASHPPVPLRKNAGHNEHRWAASTGSKKVVSSS